MKKITLIIITLNLMSNIYCQDNFNYFKYKIFSNPENDITSDKRFDEIIGKDSDTIYYELFYNNSKALFTPIDKLDNSQIQKINMNEIFRKSQGIYFYDVENEILENQKNTLGKDYIITSNYNDINWEILNEFEKIGNFTCQKAVLKRNENNSKDYIITAWFTNEINGNIAPFGLVGLKGVIVKVDFNNLQQVVLEKIEKQKKEKKIEPFKKGERISDKDYKKMVKDQMDRIRENRTKVQID